MRPTGDYTGVRLGKLVGIQRAEHYGGSDGWRWLFRCDCGNTVIRYPCNAKKTRHCGCDTVRRDQTTHGMTGTQIYNVWLGMKKRCSNPNYHHYAEYGGRGIRVCERWWNSFEAFRDDMGPRPKGGTVERVDNDGDYEPSNCRWATRAEQVKNRRNNIMVTIGNETMCLKDWCRRYGIKYTTVQNRRKIGWGDVEAITTPAGTKGFRHKERRKSA